MRISLSKADLSRVLSAVVKIPESRTTIPILSNVLLSVEDGKLTVKATDLDIEASASIAVLDAVPGTTTVDAKLLDSIVKKAGGDISLELVDGTLVVKSGHAKWSLQTLPASDYPDLNAGEFDVEFDVDLAALVAPVSFAISTEETRYYLNGVFLHTADGKLVAVSTDGHRLARHIGQDSDDIPDVILPRKLVSLLPKGQVKLALSERKVRVTTPDAILTSKLIDGTFPDYQRVIPTGNDKLVSIEKDVLQKAVERVSTVSTERGRAVRLNIDDGNVTLSVNSADHGSATEEVPAVYDDDAIEIGFNAAYLGELLSNLPGATVRIALNDGGSPTLFTAEGNDALLAVLMPMRV
ncbi:DNA polymerase III subunit beta [Mesorhizobium sp. DCY119]|uniref:DNA polymerase III subunit beta n=1 Tax=Mesorhizobium sp. DCY119 TaxID=2108445 RepID=UPI000E6C5874|nr:DNA polymerase III subunit beta [Mesorhizobium sp. DCY119]RJG46532.1 DNA polymerase III subunit beta [Mesorhizobium sp. DCY119]